MNIEEALDRIYKSYLNDMYFVREGHPNLKTEEAINLIEKELQLLSEFKKLALEGKLRDISEKYPLIIKWLEEQKEN